MILELIAVLTTLSLAALYLWFHFRATGNHSVKSVSNGYHLMLEYRNIYGNTVWNPACWNTQDFQKPTPILFPTKGKINQFLKDKL